MRLSPMAKLHYFALPGTVAFVVLFLGLAVPTIPGKVVGVLGIAVAEYTLMRLWLHRLTRIHATFTDRALCVCNKALLPATFDIPWSEVATVDRGWRYFGSPLGLRGSMLLVSPRPNAPWSRIYIFASYGARARMCEPVVASLRAAAVTHGFTVAARVGTHHAFTQPGRGWWSRQR